MSVEISDNKNNIPNVIQYGEDGFGHQLEGIFGIIGMHVEKKVNYIFNFPRRFKFAHKNVDETCIVYMDDCMKKLAVFYSQPPFNNLQRKHKHEVWKIPKEVDKNKVYSLDNAFFEPTEQLIKASPIIKDIFGKNNPNLPKPSYEENIDSIVIHVRLGDAAKRQAELSLLYNIIKYYYETKKDSILIIHTNGEIPFNECERLKIHNENTHVLQVLSDFIHAKTLIISESSLSIAATWLCDDKTTIIGPSYDKYNLKKRIRPDFIKYKDVIKK